MLVILVTVCGADMWVAAVHMGCCLDRISGLSACHTIHILIMGMMMMVMMLEVMRVICSQSIL